MEVPRMNESILHLERPIHTTLLHEFGAGAKCKTCTNCPGLVLHYWRKICTACFCKLDDHDIPQFDHKGCDIVICSLFGSKHHHNHFISENHSTLRHASREWSTSSVDGSESNTSVQTAIGPEIPFETVFRRDSSSTTTATSVGAEKARSVTYSWEPPVILAPASNSKHLKEEETQTIDINMNEEAKKNFMQLISDAKEKHFGIAKAVQCDAETIAAAPSTYSNNHQETLQQHQQHSTQILNEQKQKQKNTANLGKKCCEKCGNRMNSDETGIITAHGKTEEIFHQNCFRCFECEKLLTDLLYFFKDGKYLCGRHFGDSNYPRCLACDELILTKEYTEANGGDTFHNEHFCCSRCDIPLGGKKYVQVKNEQLCFGCHNKLFSQRCNTCKLMIQPDEQRLSHKETYWHNKLDCFRCVACNIPLSNRKFIYKHEKTFCSYECKTNYVI